METMRLDDILEKLESQEQAADITKARWSLQALLPVFKSLNDDEIDHYGPRWEASQAEGSAALEVLRTDLIAADYLNTQLHYEYYISEDAILNPIETQMCNIAALICSNCPVQVMWHTRGLMNHGGSMQEAKFAHQIGLAIAKLSDSEVGDITPVERIDFEHYTPH
ncbi:hypothetical protein LY78DRAFT_669148 [Colletotrichum sublineola]|nr:hypothetical protein LY78DRAFT_669148 [Colletotrichum sublineola]